MKYLNSIIIITTALLLTACPTQIVRMIDTYKNTLDSTNKFITANIRFDTTFTNIDDYIHNIKRNNDLMQADRLNIKFNDSLLINQDFSQNDTLINHRIFIELSSIHHNHFPDSIELRAIVYDNNGNYIAGLAPPFIQDDRNYREFWKSLTDSCNGISHLINDFSVTEVRQTTSKPYSIAFVLDHSPSMGNERALRLQNALSFTLNRIKPIDYVAIIKFAKDIFKEVPLSNKPNIYRNQFKINGLDSDRYGGGTSIYDALAIATEELSHSPDGFEKIIILFTDGRDNTSKFKPDSVLLAIKENNIRVFSIGYGLTDHRFLARVSNFTGGKFFQLMSSRDFPFIFRSLYLSLNNYYRIVYTPPVCFGKHIVSPNIEISQLNTGIISTFGYYDKSLLAEDLPIGSISMSDIEFEFGKSDIKEESFDIIENVANSLKNNPNMQIKIIGHTDDVGPDDFNLKLSLARANSVKNALISLGINKNRLSTEGKGKNFPILPNDSDENRRRNRRTEFVVIIN